MFSILGNRQLFVNEKPHIPYKKITTVQEQRVGNSGRQSPSSSDEGTLNFVVYVRSTLFIPVTFETRQNHHFKWNLTNLVLYTKQKKLDTERILLIIPILKYTGYMTNHSSD